MRKEEQWRAEGMAFCIRFLEQNNNDVDALREEIKRRGAYHVPLAIGKAEEKEFCLKVRENTFDTVMIMTLAVLHDEFGFGQKRTDRFMDCFQNAVGLLADDCINWTELQLGVKEMLHKNIEIRWHGQPPRGHV
jgi:hypothetical protein